MTPSKFRIALNRLGLNELAAARVFEVSPRHIRRCVAGTTPIPRELETLLDILTRKKTVEIVAAEWRVKVAAARQAIVEEKKIQALS